jgi:hypothetical protein
LQIKNDSYRKNILGLLQTKAVPIYNGVVIFCARVRPHPQSISLSRGKTPPSSPGKSEGFDDPKKNNKQSSEGMGMRAKPTFFLQYSSTKHKSFAKIANQLLDAIK